MSAQEVQRDIMEDVLISAQQGIVQFYIEVVLEKFK